MAVMLAPRCAACAAPLERPTRGPVCGPCWASVDLMRPPLCRLPENSAIDDSKSAGRYEGALRDIIHAFKYDGRRTLAVRLGATMRAAGSDILSTASCVVPVPLHPWRRLTRGFNQSADLAAQLDRPIVHALWRTRATTPQTGLTASGRQRNVRDAFSMSPLISRRVRRTMLAGQIVVLVDDVRTTGATLDACARVLKEAGAREVRAITIALAE
ncbi:MAG TPA: ComF family protein [Vicinamibacterales bacterium]|jgi:ComF family protein|nr:ComF family protein [Vicinamibacterales bacterium]